MSSYTIKLDGQAFNLAREMNGIIEQNNAEVLRLSEQAAALKEAAIKVLEAKQEELRKVLSLNKNAHVHLDFDYLKEHGFIFARTGCEHDSDSNPVMMMLKNVFGGSETPPNSKLN